MERDGGNLRNAATGRVFPIREGIPLFVSTVSSANLRAKRRYDWIAHFYDWFELVRPSREIREKVRRSAIQQLNLEDGMRLLEVSIGTGATIPLIPKLVDVFGIDISLNMLRACKRNLIALDRKAHLFQAEAKRLPFLSSVFDGVLHVGGISRFSDPARAVKEMIWVAKPGAQIVIADESIPPANLVTTDLKNAEWKASPGQWLMSVLPTEIKDIQITPMAENKWFCAVMRKPSESRTSS